MLDINFINHKKSHKRLNSTKVWFDVDYKNTQSTIAQPSSGHFQNSQIKNTLKAYNNLDNFQITLESQIQKVQKNNKALYNPFGIDIKVKANEYKDNKQITIENVSSPGNHKVDLFTKCLQNRDAQYNNFMEADPIDTIKKKFSKHHMIIPAMVKMQSRNAEKRLKSANSKDSTLFLPDQQSSRSTATASSLRRPSTTSASASASPRSSFSSARFGSSNISTYSKGVQATDEGKCDKQLRDAENQLMNGKGKYIFPNGTYDGEFVDGMLQGIGTFKHFNGSTYTGQYQQGSKNEFGKLTLNTGDIYKGFYKNDLKKGEGEYQWENGNRYIGYWLADKIEGRGLKYYNKGGFYLGDWKDFKKSKRGVRKWSDGEIYSGQYKNDLYHGQGMYLWADNEAYNGPYKNGKQHGIAFWFTKVGYKLTIKKGSWSNDEFQGWINDISDEEYEQQKQAYENIHQRKADIGTEASSFEEIINSRLEKHNFI